MFIERCRGSSARFVAFRCITKLTREQVQVPMGIYQVPWQHTLVEDVGSSGAHYVFIRTIEVRCLRHNWDARNDTPAHNQIINQNTPCPFT